MTPYNELANAIVMQAVKDYRKALKILRKNRNNKDAMSDAIYGLLQYPAISQLAARCGYDEVNSIKWNDVAAKIKGIYQEVIDKN